MLQAKEIARLQTIVDRFGAKATKASMAHSKEKQIARLEAQRVHVGPADRTLRVRFPDPPASGVTVLTTRRPVEGLRRAAGVRGRLVRHRPRRAAARARAERRRQDQPAADPRRRDHGQPRRLLVRPQRQRRLLRAGARQPARPTRSLLDNIRAADPAGRDAHRDPAARHARHDGPVGREGLPGERHAVGRGEDQAGAGDADGRAQQPAAARRADEQPRPAEPPVGGRRAERLEGHDRVRQPRHRVRRAARARPRCC